MTEGLESAGFDRRQSSAAIHAIANAIDKFAITPERLREALEHNNDILMERLEKRVDERTEGLEKRMDEHKGSLEKRMDERIEGLEQRMDERIEGLEQRMDERLALQSQLMRAGFEAQNRLFEERFAAERRINDERFKHQDKRLDAIEASIKTGLGRLFALSLALASAVAGVFVRVFGSEALIHAQLAKAPLLRPWLPVELGC